MLGILVLKGPEWYAQKFESVFGNGQEKTGQIATDELHYLSKVSAFEGLENAESDNTVFLGDSITQDANLNELFQSEQLINRGIGGDSTLGILNRLDDIVDMSPNKLFIMVGINDFRLGRSIDEITKSYDDILTEVKEQSPNTEVVVQSVLPVNKNINATLPDSQLITDLNSQIEELSEEQGVTYLDIHSLLANEEDMLEEEFTIDGIHLSGEGYEIWKNAIESYLP